MAKKCDIRDGFENQPAEASVLDNITAIANTTSLHNDQLQYLNGLDFYFHFKSRNSHAEDNNNFRNSEDTINDVKSKKSSSSFLWYIPFKNISDMSEGGVKVAWAAEE